MPPKTPRELGYRMPAEWEPHDATWLSWPHDPITFPDRVEKAEDAFVEIIRALSPHERVDLLVRDAKMESRVAGRLADAKVKNVRLHRIRTADIWIRDYGPNFLKRTQKNKTDVAFNRWIFNAWGNKYDTLLPDDGIPERLPTIQPLTSFQPGIVMEGGSIEVDGHGTVLTTEQCLLNPNRNPKLDQADIEKKLRDHLGVQQVLWLKEGIEGDDTDGHIDDISRFTDPNTIVTAVEPNKKDFNHKVLADNLARLRTFKDAQGKPYRIVELPMPSPIQADDGRLPASYANFYIANNVVLLPIFGVKEDAKAQSIIASLFPGRKVVPVRCEDVVYGLGTIHCLSQQQPAPVS